KSLVNSSCSAGVRSRQWRPSTRCAVSVVSKASLATLRTCARFSGSDRLGFSRTFRIWSVYARSWSVGAPAQLLAARPRVRVTAERPLRDQRMRAPEILSRSICLPSLYPPRDRLDIAAASVLNSRMTRSVSNSRTTRDGVDVADPWAAIEACYERGWTDGLPV